MNAPDVASMSAAQALLASVREVKDDFRALDEAVANHLQAQRQSTAAAATMWSVVNTAGWAGLGATERQASP